MSFNARRTGARVALLLCVLFLLVAAALCWKNWMPASVEGVAEALSAFRVAAARLSAWAAIAGVLVASVVAVPLGVIIVAMALLFGPWTGALYTLLGALFGGIVSYGVGNYLGHEGLKRFAGRRINQVSLRLAARGVLSVVIIRMLPIAPFAIVNMIAGASHLRLRDFIIGTAIGMLPGILIIAFSIGELETRWLQTPLN